MPSIFTKIITGEIASYKIAETEDCFAFLDINPNTKGHTLCVPKQEVDNLFDLDETTYNNLMLFSRRVAKAIDTVIPCERVGLSVIGLDVPHAHIHLIPIQSMEDIRFLKKEHLTSEQFEAIATKIAEAFQ